MQNKQSFLVLAFILYSALKGFSQEINWVSTTEKQPWRTKESIKLNDYSTTIPIDIEILTDKKQQTIDGWGGCFNELGWQALQTLPFKEREKVIKEFFDPKVGLKYNICRMPIGANDYSFNWYSLNETDGDFEMKNFNIERDKTVLIPYIKEALKFRPDLKIWASPWSPPTWMKTNKHYANKPNTYNDLTPENAVKSGDQFIQKNEYLTAYALYLSKFVNAYQKEGINVYAVHFQNEPYTYNQWPNCSWTALGMRNFIANYLGPKFTKDKVPAQIWFSTINSRNFQVFDTVLSQPDVRKYISGVGVQYEGLDVVAEIAKKYPQLNLMQTETPCGDGLFDWNSAENTFGTIKAYLEKGVRSYMYWNMILDNTGESSWGWKQNAQVVINKTTKKVTYTPEFYIFKHISHFVTPGSTKLEIKGLSDDALAFVTPEGKIILVAINSHYKPKNFKIKIGSKYFEVTLPQNSFNTLTL
ncbi:MAG: glycoside hydrolase family 30 protein [Chitinophagaceae bacterium]